MEIPSLILLFVLMRKKRVSLSRSPSLWSSLVRSKIELRLPAPEFCRGRSYFGAPRESRPLPTCARRREGPLFFPLPSCCYEYMEENGEPFLRIVFVGSETGTPFSRQIPLAGLAASSNYDVINSATSLTSYSTTGVPTILPYQIAPFLASGKILFRTNNNCRVRWTLAAYAGKTGGGYR